MLELNVKIPEVYNEETREFTLSHTVRVELEHSLFAVSKWESKYEKRFFTETERSGEEWLDYLIMMVVTPGFSPDVFNYLTEQDAVTIREYMTSNQTATTFREVRQTERAREEISSELIYYWMLKAEIPWEAQYWHINRLFTLIKVVAIRDAPKDKKNMPPKMSAEQRRAENQARRARANSTG